MSENPPRDLPISVEIMVSGSLPLHCHGDRRAVTPFPCPFSPSAHRLTYSSLPQYCHGLETTSR